MPKRADRFSNTQPLGVTVRRIISSLALLFATLFGVAAIAQPASAASYSKGVYAPIDKGDQIEGWADVNTNCEGTFGCYTYVKIEYLPDNLARPYWLDNAAWEYAGGGWANDGWNKVVTDYRGCGQYRMTVNAYNDAIGDAVLGVHLGVVDLNLGGGIKRYVVSTKSEVVRICHFA